MGNNELVRTRRNRSGEDDLKATYSCGFTRPLKAIHVLKATNAGLDFREITIDLNQFLQVYDLLIFHG